VHADRPAHPSNRQNQSVDISFSTVDIAPNRAVTRSGMEWHGMGVELVQSMTHERVDHSFQSPLHLLAAYQHGVRRDGESCVEGVPRSKLRNVAKKLTFVPAGNHYREWYEIVVEYQRSSATFDGGFSETSSFTAAFRKITGLTPGRYHRALG